MKSMDDLLPQDLTIAPQDELGRMLQRDALKLQTSLKKSEDISKMWNLMSSMYGHKWTSSFGDTPDPDKVWQATLFDCDWEAIQKGLGVLVKQGSEWPPAAPEFRKLCLGIEEGVNVARAPSVEATKEKLIGIEQKKTPEQLSKGAQILSDLRKGLK